MRADNEAKVGFVVIIAILAMIGGYFYIRGLGIGTEIYHLRLVSAANIGTGTDVRLQGVKIGTVRDVTLDADTQKPLLTLAIKSNTPEFKLLKTYSYTVRSDSLIGENYVDIRGPYDGNAATYIPNDSSELIYGSATTPLSDVTKVASDVSRNIGTTLSKLNVTLDKVNTGVLSSSNQLKLARALENVAILAKQAGQSFGPNGVRIGFGDASAERSLDAALNNAALAAVEARQVVGQAHSAATNINEMTIQFRNIADENRGELKGLLANLSSASHNVAGLTQSLDFLVKDSSFGDNTKIAVQSLRRAAENVEAGTAGFKAIAADSKTQQDLKDTLAALKVTSETIRDTAVTIKGVVTDPTTQKDLHDSLEVLTTTSKGLQTTIGNLNDITGSLKGIVADPALAANIKDSAQNLNGTLEATRAAAERINSLLGGHRSRTGHTAGVAATAGVPATAGVAATPGVPGSPGTATGNNTGPGTAGAAAVAAGSDLPTGFDFTFRNYSDFSGAPRIGSDVAGRNYGDVTFNSEFFGGPFRLGLDNIGSGTSVTAQTGKFVGRQAAVRYGIYRSKLGLGAEVRKGRFSLEGNVWDPNNFSANGYLGIQLTPHVELLAGRENIGGVHANSIGVRLRP